MFTPLLPSTIDNTYRGHKLAVWILAPVVAVKIAQSVLVIFRGHFVLTSADGIPLETFTPAGAQTVVAVWALLGLSRLFLLLLSVLTLLRYRSAIPFMFALLLLNYLGAQLILHFVPPVRTGTPQGPTVNLVLSVLMSIGLALSLWRRDAGATRAAPTGVT